MRIITHRPLSDRCALSPTDHCQTFAPNEKDSKSVNKVYLWGLCNWPYSRIAFHQTINARIRPSALFLFFCRIGNSDMTCANDGLVPSSASTCRSTRSTMAFVTMFRMHTGPSVSTGQACQHILMPQRPPFAPKRMRLSPNPKPTSYAGWRNSARRQRRGWLRTEDGFTNTLQRFDSTPCFGFPSVDALSRTCEWVAKHCGANVGNLRRKLLGGVGATKHVKKLCFPSHNKLDLLGKPREPC